MYSVLRAYCTAVTSRSQRSPVCLLRLDSTAPTRLTARSSIGKSRGRKCLRVRSRVTTTVADDELALMCQASDDWPMWCHTRGRCSSRWSGSWAAIRIVNARGSGGGHKSVLPLLVSRLRQRYMQLLGSSISWRTAPASRREGQLTMMAYCPASVLAPRRAQGLKVCSVGGMTYAGLSKMLEGVFMFSVLRTRYFVSQLTVA